MMTLLVVLLFIFLSLRDIPNLIKDKLYKDAGITAGFLLIGFIVSIIATLGYRLPLSLLW